ncbi:MAG: anthranilate synthase component I family protein [Actinomycetota bacterium]
MAVSTALDLDAILARLPLGTDLVVVRDGPRVIVAVSPDAVLRVSGPRALEALDSLYGWWAGFCSYDLGRAVEKVPAVNPPDLEIPDLVLGRFDARLVCEPDGTHYIEGTGPSARTLEQMLATSPRAHEPPRLNAWRSSLDRRAFHEAAAQILRHLRAGDCYQVNLTRRLETDIEADPIELFRAVVRGNPSPHSALVRIGDVAVVSASPERYLRGDGTRIETRPIKGTSSDPAALAVSAKDRSENVMIVDLSRNDLGRVCEYESVHVPELCAIEEHPGLYHLVSTVVGTLRQGVRSGELIRATFPPASVTGCPKPRVLEIIETLEPVRRGVYCGAVGFIDTDRQVLDLNVAIRTFTTAGGKTYFGVGGGVVADSDPAAEWDETELKASRLLALAAGGASP